MYAEAHADYDVFWEQDGAVVCFAIIGHAVGKPPEPDQIAFTGTFQAE